MISIVKNRKIWYAISLTMFIVSLVGYISVGLRFGIDFTGGSLLELQFTQRPAVEDVKTALASLSLESLSVQPVGESNVLIRFGHVPEEVHVSVVTKLKETYGGADMTGVQEVRFESIGPSLGQELKQRTFWAIVLALIGIIAYIAWAFRKVSKPVSSWAYGCIAAIALFHDVFITVGAFVILGSVYGMEVNAPFVAALLTVLGYSVNDTIVLFDRTRENLLRRTQQDFSLTVEQSLQETMVRSMNASCTVLLTLFAILAFGGDTIRDFVLALIIGLILGTYSSIFIASPLLVSWQKFRAR